MNNIGIYEYIMINNSKQIMRSKGKLFLTDANGSMWRK